MSVALHDIDDVYAFAADAVRRFRSRATPDEREEMTQAAVAILYELAAEFDPARSPSFAGYAARYLPARLHDWWLGQRPHLRRDDSGEPAAVFVEFDELDRIGPVERDRIAAGNESEAVPVASVAPSSAMLIEHPRMAGAVPSQGPVASVIRALCAAGAGPESVDVALDAVRSMRGRRTPHDELLDALRLLEHARLMLEYSRPEAARRAGVALRTLDNHRARLVEAFERRQAATARSCTPG